MTDEMQVNQPSKAPVILLGTGLGAIAGGAATQIPQVKSYLGEGVTMPEFTLKKDEFKSSLEKAPEDIQKAMTQAWEEAQGLEGKYQAQLDKYLADNAAAEAVLPENHKALQDLAKAQNDYNTKFDKLVEEEAAKIRATQTNKAGEVTTKVIKFEGAESSANKWVTRLYHTANNAEGKETERQFNEWINQVVDNFYQKDIETAVDAKLESIGTTGGKYAEDRAKMIKEAKSAKAKEIRDIIQTRVSVLDRTPAAERLDRSKFKWLGDDATKNLENTERLIKKSTQDLSQARYDRNFLNVEKHRLDRKLAEAKSKRQQGKVKKEIADLNKKIEATDSKVEQLKQKVAEYNTLKTELTTKTHSVRISLPETSTKQTTISVNGQKTEEEILAQAKKAIKDDALKAEKDAVTTAETAVAEARAALPKNGEKTVDELTKEFIEKNGSKEEFVKKGTNDIKDKLSKETKAFFEKKISNKWIAGLVAGGAVAGLLIGAMCAPKGDKA